MSAGLYKAACTLGTTREELVLSLAPNPQHPIKWDNATIEAAVRSGLVGAIDDAKRRGELPGIVADALAIVAEKAPVQWLIDGGQSLDGSLSGLGNLLNGVLGLAGGRSYVRGPRKAGPGGLSCRAQQDLFGSLRAT